MREVDGRKLRLIDCDWNNLEGTTGCGICSVCKYLDYIDWAESVGKPDGSVIERNKTIEKYVMKEFKSINEKQEYLLIEFSKQENKE